MMKYRTFLLGLLVIFLLAIGACYLVDPYGFNRKVEVTGFNQQKEGVRNVIRYAKAIEISLRKPETILMGSSRVHDGLDPAYKTLQEYGPVYNYGIDMLRINEAKRYLQHAIVNSKIKKVIFGLDFFMFNALERYNPAFDSSLVGRKVDFLDVFRTSLPSKYVVSDIFSTIKISRTQRDRKEFLQNGYRPASSVFFHLADYKKLHYYTNWIFLSDNKMSTPYYGRYLQDEQTFNCLDEFLKICKDNNIECTLFITPAHALLDGEGIYLSGLWEKMEGFKRRITGIAGANHVALWDFSGYNRITTEEVKTPMKFYWDSSHFTEDVGNLILEQILRPQANNPAYFGTALNAENLEEHLQQIRESRAKYLVEHQAEVKWIGDMYAKIKANMPMPKEEVANMFY